MDGATLHWAVFFAIVGAAMAIDLGFVGRKGERGQHAHGLRLERRVDLARRRLLRDSSGSGTGARRRSSTSPPI